MVTPRELLRIDQVFVWECVTVLPSRRFRTIAFSESVFFLMDMAFACVRLSYKTLGSYWPVTV